MLVTDYQLPHGNGTVGSSQTTRKVPSYNNILSDAVVWLADADSDMIILQAIDVMKER